MKEFCRGGCGCSTNCASAFTQKHYLATRGNAQQLERKELDMAVMGQVMAFTFCSQVPQNISKHRHQVKQRERNASAFYHNGLRVCKRTFLFLHDIGDFRLKAIRAQYVREGLVPRVHGHTGRVAPNALVLEEVKSIITFVMQQGAVMHRPPRRGSVGSVGKLATPACPARKTDIVCSNNDIMNSTKVQNPRRNS